MFELIYKYCRENDPYDYDIIVLCRMRSMKEIIDNIVIKYDIHLEEEPIESYYKEGFWIREISEKPLNENALNHCIEYYKNTEWKRK